MPRYISKTSTGPDAFLSGLGQGLSNFAGAYMGKQQMRQGEDYNNKMLQMMQNMYGGGGQQQGMQPQQPQNPFQFAHPQMQQAFDPRTIWGR